METLDAGECLTDFREIRKERSLPIAEAVGGERRDRHDRDRIPQRLLQEPPKPGDQPVREVVEAPEAGEAEEARDENDHIWRLHRTYLPRRPARDQPRD